MTKKHREITYEIDDNGCHICTSHAKTFNGYPKIKVNQKDLRMSRFLYAKAYGEIPEGLLVRHKCDNRACINLDHLELGTHAQNTRDMVERGRLVNFVGVGEENPRAKLDEATVRLIKSDKTSTNKALAAIYGVHHSTISAIRKGKIWSYV